MTPAARECIDGASYSLCVNLVDLPFVVFTVATLRMDFSFRTCDHYNTKGNFRNFWHIQLFRRRCQNSNRVTKAIRHR